MNTIITIGRQYGCGGAKVAETLAERLGVKCYDKEILYDAAKVNGMCEVVAEHYDEGGLQSFLYSLASEGTVGKYVDCHPVYGKLHNAQFQLIRSVADKGDSCVFLGRCADYVLEEYDNVISVYLSADLGYRVEETIKKYDISESEALKLVHRRDKQRADYYNYYTNKIWSDIGSYDLCINTADVGIDGAVDMILNYIELKNKNKNKHLVTN